MDNGSAGSEIERSRPTVQAYRELREALEADDGQDARMIAEATARALDRMAEIEATFSGECRRAVPFGHLFTVFLPDGSVQVQCTHEPPHVEAG
jgi:hypothetical protein